MTTSFVSSGGYAVGRPVTAGNTLEVLSSGTVIDTMVSNGGYLVLEPGAVSNYTTVFSGGEAEVLAGATDNDATISANGELYVYAGGAESGTTVSSGGGATVNGTFLGGSIIDGYMNISSPGLVSGTLVTSAGIMDVYSGGTTSAVLLQGGILHSSGVYNPANEVVMNGGSAKATVDGFEGVLDIDSGATASATDIDLGYLDLFAGGTSLSATLVSGEEETAGTSISATVNSGGAEYVDSGGTTSKAMIYAGGYEDVRSDGAAVSTTVFDGGTLYVDRGGVSVSGIIAGGIEDDSGLVLSPTISGGSLVLLNANGAGSSVITFAGPDAKLELDSVALPTNVIAGFGPTDTIAYSGTVTAAHYKALTSTTGTLTLINVTTTIGTLTLSGSLSQTDFYVTPGLSAAMGSVTDVTLGGAPADYNADTQSDLVLASDAGPIVIESQSGLVVTGGATISNPGQTWHVMSTADMDGNGSPDLLLQNDDGNIVDYIMSGTTVLAGFDLTDPGPTWHVRGVGDFNSDGKADIVLQQDGTGLIAIDYTNGSAVIGGAIVSDPGPSWTVEGVADFNGDGQPDLLLENTNGQIVDFIMNGATPVAGYLLATLQAGWSVAGTGNYNDDPYADIVVHNDNGSDVMLDTNGQSVIGSYAPIGDSGPSWTGVVAGMDYNGDGQSDLLLENTSGSLVGFTLNGTAFAGASLGTPGVGWRAIGNTPMEFIDGTAASLAPLNGTVGADEFNFTSLGVAGLHSINGFDPSMDLVALSSATFANYAAVQAAEQPYQGGTFIALSAGSGLLVQGVTPSQLSSSNFVLR